MKVLAAGIGNVFFGDDGFGVEVADRMACTPLPDGVRLHDYGIRGIHLAYELLDGYDALVLIDALPMGEEPGTVAVLEVDPDDVVAPSTMDAHSMSPATVLGLLAGLGGTVGTRLRRRLRAGVDHRWHGAEPGGAGRRAHGRPRRARAARVVVRRDARPGAGLEGRTSP